MFGLHSVLKNVKHFQAIAFKNLDFLTSLKESSEVETPGQIPTLLRTLVGVAPWLLFGTLTHQPALFIPAVGKDLQAPECVALAVSTAGFSSEVAGV